MKFLAKEGLRPNGRLLFRALLAFSILLLGTLPVAAQTDLTGFWVLRVPTGDGNFRESFLDLKQVRRESYRQVLRNGRETPITDGTFSNGKLHLVVTLHFQTRNARMTYDGTMEGGKISMTRAVSRARPDRRYCRAHHAGGGASSPAPAPAGTA